MSDWKEYEKQIHNKLSSKFNDCQIEFDKKIKGRYSQVDRQIDISIKKNVTFRTVFGAVDCKCYSKKVDVKDVDTFIGLLDDVKAEFGIIITTLGFTAAAKNRADASKIELVIIEYENIDMFKVDWLFSSLHVEGNLEIECEKCENLNIFDQSEIIFEVQNSQERSMGSETLHSFSSEFYCAKCDNIISFTLDAWEYPMGSVNFIDSDVTGGVIITKPSIEYRHEYDEELDQ